MVSLFDVWSIRNNAIIRSILSYKSLRSLVLIIVFNVVCSRHDKLCTKPVSRKHGATESNFPFFLYRFRRRHVLLLQSATMDQRPSPSLLRRVYASLPPSSPTTEYQDVPQLPELESRPVLSNHIATLPTELLSNDFFPFIKPWQGQSCSICLDDFESGQDVKLFPCGHFYHSICATRMLAAAEKELMCAECRASVFAENYYCAISQERREAWGLDDDEDDEEEFDEEYFLYDAEPVDPDEQWDLYLIQHLLSPREAANCLKHEFFDYFESYYFNAGLRSEALKRDLQGLRDRIPLVRTTTLPYDPNRAMFPDVTGEITPQEWDLMVTAHLVRKAYNDLKLFAGRADHQEGIRPPEQFPSSLINFYTRRDELPPDEIFYSCVSHYSSQGQRKNPWTRYIYEA